MKELGIFAGGVLSKVLNNRLFVLIFSLCLFSLLMFPSFSGFVLCLTMFVFRNKFYPPTHGFLRLTSPSRFSPTTLSCWSVSPTELTSRHVPAMPSRTMSYLHAGISLVSCPSVRLVRRTLHPLVPSHGSSHNTPQFATHIYCIHSPCDSLSSPLFSSPVPFCCLVRSFFVFSCCY